MDMRDPESGEPIDLPAWLIADRGLLKGSRSFRYFTSLEPGWIKSAPTVAERARKIVISANALEASIARFNQFCVGHQDADFHRGEIAWERYAAGSAKGAANPTLGGITQGPFIAMSFNRGILSTKVGPRTNSRGQVVHPAGTVIAGLNCTGNAMVNPFGTGAIGVGTTMGLFLT